MEQIQETQERIVVVTSPLGDKVNMLVYFKLLSLGCSIRQFEDRQEVTFPEGTTKEYRPQLGRAIRFILTLPTKDTLHCVEMPNREHYNILLPAEKLWSDTRLSTLKGTFQTSGVRRARR